MVTSVTRDDLPDGGAVHFAETIREVRRSCPGAVVEVLVPDFQGSVQALDVVVAARPDVFNHNLETVPRLYAAVRPQAGYKRSLAVLRHAADYGLAVKSGLMLGLGETRQEIMDTLRDLKRAGCGFLTLGQYLAPSTDGTPPWTVGCRRKSLTNGPIRPAEWVSGVWPRLGRQGPLGHRRGFRTVGPQLSLSWTGPENCSKSVAASSAAPQF